MFGKRDMDDTNNLTYLQMKLPINGFTIEIAPIIVQQDLVHIINIDFIKTSFHFSVKTQI